MVSSFLFKDRKNDLLKVLGNGGIRGSNSGVSNSKYIPLWYFQSLMKKLERPGKRLIQLKSEHFELLIHSNVNYLSFKVRQTDLFLSYHVSVSISYGSCVSFNILISKTVVGRIR